MSSPLPVVMCGGKSQIGAKAIEGLKPEYEVIHFLSSREAGIADLPSIVLGRAPPSATVGEENIGSRNYDRKPVAILAGGMFNDEDVAAMRDAIRGEAGEEGEKVPWLRADMSNVKGPVEPNYGAQVAKRAKDMLKEVIESGNGNGGGVYWY